MLGTGIFQVECASTLTLGVVDKMKVTSYPSLNLSLPAIHILQKIKLSYFCWLVLLLLHLRRYCLCFRPRFPSPLSHDALIQALVFWGFIPCYLSVVCGMRYGYTFLPYVAVQHHCWKDTTLLIEWLWYPCQKSTNPKCADLIFWTLSPAPMICMSILC